MDKKTNPSVFEAPVEIPYVEEAAAVNQEEFAKVVKSRRSVRVFESEKIPEDIVRKCLDLALLAPNSSNLQPWEFYWIRTPLVREALNVAFLSQPAVTTASELIVCIARTSTWKQNSKQMLTVLDEWPELVPPAVKSYYSKIVPLIYSVGPLGIWGLIKRFIFGVRGFWTPTPREHVSREDLKIWAVKSAALACENLMLAFRAAGFDSCPMEGCDTARVKRILRLPSDAVFVMGIAAGRRSSKGVYGPQIRFPSNQFIKEI